MLEKQLISIEQKQLPEVFLGYNAPVENALDIVHQSPDRWTEFVSHLSQFNQFGVSETKNQIKSLITHSAPNEQASLQAGLAKCYIGEGLFLKAIQTLGYAFSLLNNSHHDTQSFVMLEMVNLLTVIGNRDQANYLLKSGQSLAQSEYLQHVYNYYELVNKARQGDTSVLNTLIESGEYYKSNNQLATLAFHYKNIGNIYGKMQDTNTASSFYKMALDICKSEQYSHIQSAINHDKGMLEFKMGNADKALHILNAAAESAESKFTKAYTLGNIGFIHFKQENHKDTIQSFNSALNIANQHGVFHLIPGMCYYLGKSSQKLGIHSQAKAYLHQGYKASMELAKHKFPLKGEKLMVIDAYVESMSQNPQDSLDDEQFSFTFAIDKSLKEIRATFQNAVLDSVLNLKGSVADTVDHLKMSPSSFSKIKNRNKNIASNSIPQEITEYIKSHSNTDWKELNTEFEKEVLQYLHKEYKYNKRKLSNKLEVNYSRLVSKMNCLANRGEA